ncbi:MAG: flagellar protein FliT [Dethiobacter sp.]|nr:MAG: flagellar protein FliT [Dethiobacter sp.]
MVNKYIFRLVQEYEKQFSLYSDIHQSAHQLQCLCANADFRETESLNSLNKLLQFRQVQMQSIEKSQQIATYILTGLNSCLEMAGIDGIELAELLPSPETKRLKEIIVLLEPILKETVSLDAGSRELLQLKLDSLKDESLKLQKGRDASRAYKPGREQHAGVFMDGKHC